MDTNQALNAKQQSCPHRCFIANDDLGKPRTSVNEGLDAGLTVNEIKEILLMRKEMQQ